MAVLNLPVEPSDLDDSGWESVLAIEKRDTVDGYARSFNKLSKERQVQGKNNQAAAIALLSVVCGFVLTPGKDGGPYAPVMSGPDGRTGLPEDLSQSELDILAHVFPNVGDYEFRSRLGDLLWLLRRDYKAGQIAVAAYLAAAEQLEGEGEYLQVPVRIERALQIAAQLGGGGGVLLKQVLDIAASFVRNRAAATITLRTADLLDLLIERDSDNLAEQRAATEQSGRAE